MKIWKLFREWLHEHYPKLCKRCMQPMLPEDGDGDYCIPCETWLIEIDENQDVSPEEKMKADKDYLGKMVFLALLGLGNTKKKE